MAWQLRARIALSMDLSLITPTWQLATLPYFIPMGLMPSLASVVTAHRQRTDSQADKTPMHIKIIKRLQKLT